MKVRGVSANIYVGNKNPKLNLIALVTYLLFPRFLIIQEAKNFKGSIPGYRAYRAPRHLTNSNDYRSTIFLVRRGTKVVEQDWQQVPKGQWQYHDNKREARVFGRITLALKRKRLDVYGVHRCPLGPIPPRPVNREAWIAEHNFLTDWYRSSVDSIFGGDWNTRETSHPEDKFSLRALAKAVRSKTYVLGIDGFLTSRNLRVNKLRKLNRKFGSDAHHPVVIDFEL